MAGGWDQARTTAYFAAWSTNSGTATLGTETITGPQLLRLMTANGTDSSNGTEASTSGGYTAGGLSMTCTGGTAQLNNSAAVTWTSMPGITSTGAEQWESTATKKRGFWAPWSSGSIVIGAGNTFQVAINGWNPTGV